MAVAPLSLLSGLTEPGLQAGWRFYSLGRLFEAGLDGGNGGPQGRQIMLDNLENDPVSNPVVVAAFGRKCTKANWLT